MIGNEDRVRPDSANNQGGKHTITAPGNHFDALAIIDLQLVSAAAGNNKVRTEGFDDLFEISYFLPWLNQAA